MSVQIQTHSGIFHADDVTAVTLLSNYYHDLDYEVKVIRSRDPETFSQSDILIDVGKVYDPENKKFDHHQESCNETWNDHTNIPLSSVGMVWKHYGALILNRFLEKWNNNTASDEDIDNLVDKIYFSLILELDANDNGINLIEGGKRNYWSNLNLPSIVASCNEKNVNDIQTQDDNFRRAMILVTQILDIKFNYIINSYFDFQKDIQCVQSILDLDLEYLVIPTDIPTIYKCLKELDPEYRIKFLIFVSDEEITVKTRGKKTFENIVDILPEQILRRKLTHPEELLFVHKALFIAKCDTLNTAKEIVQFSLDIYNNMFSRVKRSLLDKSYYLTRPLTKYAAVGALGIVGSYLYLKNSNE